MLKLTSRFLFFGLVEGEQTSCGTSRGRSSFLLVSRMAWVGYTGDIGKLKSYNIIRLTYISSKTAAPMRFSKSIKFASWQCQLILVWAVRVWVFHQVDIALWWPWAGAQGEGMWEGCVDTMLLIGLSVTWDVKNYGCWSTHWGWIHINNSFIVIRI